MRAALRYGPRRREYRELEMGDVRMDTVARKVFVNHVAVELTPTEFKLLHVLLCEGGRVVTHRQLLTEVWGASYCDEVQYLRVFMRQLRAKIEDDASQPRRIVTALGVGYRLAEVFLVTRGIRVPRVARKSRKRPVRPRRSQRRARVEALASLNRARQRLGSTIALLPCVT